MLNRLLIGAAGLVAGTLVATPAVLGLSGNSSFSRDLHVPVPSGAHQVHFDDSSDAARHSAEPEPSESREDRPGSGVVSSDANDDHGGRAGSGGSGRGGLDDGAGHDAGDDRGGDRQRSGDDGVHRQRGRDSSGGDDGSGGHDGSGGSGRG
jgi:hypothetical protein